MIPVTKLVTSLAVAFLLLADYVRSPQEVLLDILEIRENYTQLDGEFLMAGVSSGVLTLVPVATGRSFTAPTLTEAVASPE